MNIDTSMVSNSIAGVLDQINQSGSTSQNKDKINSTFASYLDSMTADTSSKTLGADKLSTLDKIMNGISDKMKCKTSDIYNALEKLELRTEDLYDSSNMDEIVPAINEELGLTQSSSIEQYIEDLKEVVEDALQEEADKYNSYTVAKIATDTNTKRTSDDEENAVDELSVTEQSNVLDMVNDPALLGLAGGGVISNKLLG